MYGDAGDKGTKRPSAGARTETNGVAPVTAVTAEVMTLTEAAAWLRVSEAGLRADADSGRLPARLVAGEWRFNKAALLEWLSHPEPPASRPKTGAELVEHIRRVRAASSDPETEEEAEEFIRQMYARRKADSAAG